MIRMIKLADGRRVVEFGEPTKVSSIQLSPLSDEAKGIDAHLVPVDGTDSQFELIDKTTGTPVPEGIKFRLIVKRELQIDDLFGDYTGAVPFVNAIRLQGRDDGAILDLGFYDGTTPKSDKKPPLLRCFLSQQAIVQLKKRLAEDFS